MELFKIFGTLALNGVDEFNKDVDDATKKGSGLLKKVGNGAIAVGKTVGKGLVVAGTAMGALTAKSLNMAGELEQNMGGSEAVFKEYANSMQETAKEAFSSMGLSTSDFLATANKMGALFQGSGFSIQESSELSAKAMQRAADVASIMGIDTTSAMEAIAGAAKGNFTMMDNLGVAMNDTTLQAYALEKGISKSTSEMTNQEKIGLAMEMFLEKTSYAAGNYAKENETLAGSLGTAKSALTNFLDGSGSVEQLVGAFSGAANVIVKNLQEIIPNLTTGLTQIINQIVPMLPPLIQQLLPAIITGAISLINGLVAAMPMVVSSLIDCLPALIDGVVQIMDGLITALPAIFSALVAALPTLLPQLISGVVALIVALAGALPDIIMALVNALPDIMVSIVDALISNLPILIDGAIQLVIGLVSALPQIMIALIEAVPRILSTIWENIKEVFAPVAEWFGGVFEKAKQAISNAWSSVTGFFTGIWDGIVAVFSAVVDWFSEQFSAAWEGIKAVWEAVTGFFTGIWEGIKNAFAAVGSWFKEKFNEGKENAQNAWNNVKTFFSNRWADIKGAFANVKSFFSEKFSDARGAAEGAWEGISNFFSGAWDGIKNVFKNAVDVGKKIVDDIKEGIRNAWEGLKNWFNNLWDSLFKGRKVDVSVNGSSEGTSATPHANGLDYVPYDGYLASLHKGEMVIPAAESRMIRNGFTGFQDSGEVASLLRQILYAVQDSNKQETVIKLDNREFGRAVRGYVNA